MDRIKNILFFVVLTAIICAIVVFEIVLRDGGSSSQPPHHPASTSLGLGRGWRSRRAAARPIWGRALPSRFHAVNASRIRWEILRACIFWMTAALWCSAVLELMRN